jgi:membrane fusion protein (multidrug efflux system)
MGPHHAWCRNATEVIMRATIWSLLLVCGLAVPALAQQPPAPVSVGVVKADRTSIKKTLTFVGRVEAVNRVEVRARVTGYLEEVLFKEGELIKAGAPLYRIEHGLYQAAVEQAQGALERSNASRALTKIQLERAQDLVEKSAGTVVARDQAKAADDQAKGAIMQDEANLATAKINLGYTDIASPIEGEVGKTNLTKGNVVSPDSGVLTVIVSQNPMYVTFPVSDRELLLAREAGREIGYTDFKDFKVNIRFSNGSLYDQQGKIDFINVQVDRTTDTVLARATVPNAKGVLIDGQLVTAEVEIGRPQEKVVVPQSALIADQGGVYVFVVEDGKAVRKDVKTGGAAGTGVVIDDGLKGGELVIVERLQAVRPGGAVIPQPVEPALSGG